VRPYWAYRAPMASPEYESFKSAAASRPAPPPADVVEQRRRIDEAMSQVPLANGVEVREFMRAGVSGLECRPATTAADTPIVLWFHGGGFRIASSLAYRSFGSHLASVFNARIVLPDYRLAPEHPFPAAVNDCFAVWESLLADGEDVARIVIAGDSAGGALAGATTVQAIEDGVLPAGVMLVSPWVDLTVSSSSYDSRAELDSMFSRDAANEAAPAYLGSTDPRHPLASPLFADWTGSPPVQILVGDHEVLLDDSLALANSLVSAGVDATLSVYPEMPHIFPFNYPAFPEAVDGVLEMKSFINRVIGRF